MADATKPRCALGLKVLVWIAFAFHALCSCTYIGLAVASAVNVDKVQSNLKSVGMTYIGLMASLIMGIIVVALFLILCPIVLIGKNLGSDMTLHYGALLGMSFISSCFMLLAGIVLNGGDDIAGALTDAYLWKSIDHTTYQATFSFAYICCGTFLMMMIWLFFARHAFGRSDKYHASSGGAKPQDAPAASWPPTEPTAAAGSGAGAWPTANPGGNAAGFGTGGGAATYPTVPPA